MPDFKRLPALNRNVIEIKEDDIRVRVLGKIIDKSENMLILDDGTGKLDLITENVSNINVGDTAFAFVRVMNFGKEFHAELIQNMNKLDLDLYKNVFNN